MMKKLVMLMMLQVLCGTLMAQDSMEKVMEKRAREMHRVLCTNDKEQWKKFIEENYTQALIDRPAKSNVVKSPSGASEAKPTEAAKPTSPLESKVIMFERLHNDFGNSKIISIKPTESRLDMDLDSGNGLRGTFHLNFDPKKPYLIDGIGVQAVH